MEVAVFLDVNMVLLAERLLIARRRAGLSQTSVAWRADLDLSNYNEIEKGKSGGMRIETLYRLCQVCNVSADYLLGLEAENAL